MKVGGSGGAVFQSPSLSGEAAAVERAEVDHLGFVYNGVVLFKMIRQFQETFIRYLGKFFAFLCSVWIISIYL